MKVWLVTGFDPSNVANVPLAAFDSEQKAAAFVEGRLVEHLARHRERLIKQAEESTRIHAAEARSSLTVVPVEVA